MNGAIGDILPLALGVAISPIPVVAAILMLFSAHAGSTSTGFLIGWLAGIIVGVTLFTVLAGSLTSNTDSSGGVSWTKVGLGALLLMVGLRQWRGRHDKHGPPKWMGAIDRMGFAQALGLGFLLSAVNPKNLIMLVAAGVAIGAAGLSVGQDVVVIAIYTVIAACTVAIPVIAYAIAKDKMRVPLDTAKTWLEENNATVMAVLILVIGVVLIGKGIGGF